MRWMMRGRGAALGGQERCVPHTTRTSHSLTRHKRGAATKEARGGADSESAEVSCLGGERACLLSSVLHNTGMGWASFTPSLFLSHGYTPGSAPGS